MDVTRVKDLLEEVRVYQSYKKDLLSAMKRLWNDYHGKKIDYFTYKERLDKLLRGRTKQEVIGYYDSYIKTLLAQVEEHTAEMFYTLYNDQSFDRHKEALKQGPKEKKPSLIDTYVKKKTEEPLPQVKIEEVPVEIEEKKPEKEPEEEIPEAPKLPGPKEEHKPLMVSIGEGWNNLIKSIKEALRKPFKADKKTKKEPPMPWLKAEKPSIKDKMTEPLKKVEKRVEEKIPTEEIKELFTFDFVKRFFRRKSEDSIIGETTELEPALVSIRKVREVSPFEEEEADITGTLLKQEAKKIRGILKNRPKISIYEPSSLGSLANLTVRQISLFFIENFPGLFKSLYNNLRAANIKILSNTYVNIIVLLVLVALSLSTVVFVTAFTITSKSLVQGLTRGLFTAVMIAFFTAVFFFYYPSMKIKQRRRSINTNLTFAINHMAAVAGSGVSPVAMFRLIADAKEYEEISVEIEKVVTFIDLYGYDVMTAIKAVAATGPSPELSEFFSGFVATIETGGDLKSFLRQKADEAMLNYRLERQTYLETISTYTDVYTGILIASPLFFVVALTLVNMLGGKIGGFSISSIMIFGTYVIIPLLNIGFLIFIEATQPEV
ncbi:MAG: type II secretion system F family protein [Nanoarchaeota archaeon]|nr:type II secretion system F family protein [Nanoarchaeota archaeon]